MPLSGLLGSLASCFSPSLPENLLRPTTLYRNDNIDLPKLRKLINEGKLVPIFVGAEEAVGSTPEAKAYIPIVMKLLKKKKYDVSKLGDFFQQPDWLEPCPICFLASNKQHLVFKLPLHQLGLCHTVCPLSCHLCSTIPCSTPRAAAESACAPSASCRCVQAACVWTGSRAACSAAAGNLAVLPELGLEDVLSHAARPLAGPERHSAAFSTDMPLLQAARLHGQGRVVSMVAWSGLAPVSPLHCMPAGCAARMHARSSWAQRRWRRGRRSGLRSRRSSKHAYGSERWVCR